MEIDFFDYRRKVIGEINQGTKDLEKDFCDFLPPNFFKHPWEFERYLKADKIIEESTHAFMGNVGITDYKFTREFYKDTNIHIPTRIGYKLTFWERHMADCIKNGCVICDFIAQDCWCQMHVPLFKSFYYYPGRQKGQDGLQIQYAIVFSPKKNHGAGWVDLEEVLENSRNSGSMVLNCNHVNAKGVTRETVVGILTVLLGSLRLEIFNPDAKCLDEKDI